MSMTGRRGAIRGAQSERGGGIRGASEKAKEQSPRRMLHGKIIDAGAAAGRVMRRRQWGRLRNEKFYISNPVSGAA